MEFIRHHAWTSILVRVRLIRLSYVFSEKVKILKRLVEVSNGIDYKGIKQKASQESGIIGLVKHQKSAQIVTKPRQINAKEILINDVYDSFSNKVAVRTFYLSNEDIIFKLYEL